MSDHPPAPLILRQGPIHLRIQAYGCPGHVHAAYDAARHAFPAILPALAAELPLLRTPLPSARPGTCIARAMHEAVSPFIHHRITPMAAVAGAVADHMLGVMLEAAPLDRAFVNDGGDIALHLAPGQSLRCALVTRLDAPAHDATIVLHAEQPSRGLATSGRACRGQGGSSFSFGIADSVTVLAATAARADAAATVIGNATTLDHPGIVRRQACEIDPESDLGNRRITWAVPHLSAPQVGAALAAGRAAADALVDAGLIHGAILALQGQATATGMMPA